MMMRLNYLFEVGILKNISIKIFLILLLYNLIPTTAYSEKVSFEQAQSFYGQEQYEKTFLALNSLLDTNNPEVFNLLGDLYYSGEFVDQNYGIAKDYYQKAINLDFAPAFIKIGVMHENGYFFDIDIEVANKYYLLAHDLGNSTGTYYFAVNLQFGAGVKQNINRSIEFYEEAIRRGNESAVIDLANLYVNEDFNILDYEKSYYLFKSLADKGVNDAQYNLGQMYEFGHFVNGNSKKAFDLYYLAHLGGFAPATYAIGELYYYGYPENKPNYELAWKYYQLAADLEYPQAFYSLAWMIDNEEGRERNSDEALEYYIKAADLGDASALNALGLIYSNIENGVFDVVKSREFYKKSYNLGDYFAPLNLARSYNYYVNYAERNKELNLHKENIKKDIIEARYWYSKAIEIGNYEGFYEYAETFSNEGDFESARNILIKGLKISQAPENPDYVMKTHLLSYLSGYYESQGYAEESLHVMKLAVEEVKSSTNFQPTHIAMTYRDYAASLNNNGFPIQALEYYKKSEQLLRDENEFELLAPTLNGKAIVLSDLKKYEESINNFNLAFDAIRHFEGDVDQDLGMIHSNIVDPLLQLGRLDTALFHAKKAVEIFSIIKEGHPWHMAVLTDLARVYDKLGKYNAAQETFTFATELFTKRYFSLLASDLDIFKFNEYYKNLRTISSAAEFSFLSYKRKNNLNDLNLAFVNYQKARITTAEFEMARLSNRFNSLSADSSEQVRKYQVLSDKIDELKWSQLNEIISGNKDKIDKSQLFYEINELESKKNNLKINSEPLNKIKNLNDRILNLSEVQKSLSDDQLLVFPAETFSDAPVSVFLISNKKITTLRTTLNASDLRDLGLKLRASLNFNGTSNITDLPKFDLDLSFKIFRELFSDVLNDFKNIKDLIVIPTWPISNLPLAVLVSDDPAKTDYGYDKQSWLGLEKNISYLPSVSDLKMLEKSNNTELFASFIGFGDPELGQKTNNLRGIKFVDIEDDELSKSYQLDLLPSLPSTAEELQAIKNIFSDGKSEIYTQENATEDVIKSKDLSNYNVLLFATHGVIADEWEFLDEAALVMTPPKNTNTANNDGLLTTSEIRKLNLNADLVVLSACNTASGDNQSDEGLSGLASAFIFAGAKSIMASHWSVESNTTKQLITTFFENLKISSKMTRSEAMRLSMKKLFSDHRYKHPIFWAPFILVGQS